MGRHVGRLKKKKKAMTVVGVGYLRREMEWGRERRGGWDSKKKGGCGWVLWEAEEVGGWVMF